MPLFGATKRPKLDGLTSEDEARRDALNPQVQQRAGTDNPARLAAAGVEVLGEKAEQEKTECLWMLLLGWQLMSMRRFTAAIDAFNGAIERDGKEVRGYYGAGSAYVRAAQAKRSMGAAITDEQVPPNLTTQDLFREALAKFASAGALTKDRGEVEVLKKATASAEESLRRMSA